jgi:RNA polymerase sigma-70 factor (sigma-E family)
MGSVCQPGLVVVRDSGVGLGVLVQAEEPQGRSEVVAFDLVPVSESALSFDAFYREHFRRVAALAYGLSGSREAAEELAQEAFAAAHAKWRSVQSLTDPGAWVRRVAMNKARSAFRRRQAERRALTRLGGRRQLPAELPSQSDTFWAAVRLLPAKQAMVIALHYADDRPIEDIANILGCSPGTVKTHLYRARQRIMLDLSTKDGPINE